MPWSKWNRADKTLLAAAVLFAFSLCLHLSFPESLFAKGLLFCTEAALVGGVADWFAVTALFEKPLGFPWHTALLPRRRAEFMEAAAKLVRREFFSRQAVFSLTARYDWKAVLLRWLDSESVRNMLITEIRRIIGNAACDIDAAEKSKEWAAQLRHTLLSVPLSRILEATTIWLRSDANDQRLFGALSSYLRAWAIHPETRDQLAALFERIREEKLAGAGFLMNLLAGVASAMNVINFDDLAACAQQEALRLLDEADDPDSPFGRRLRGAFYEKLEALGENETAQEAFAAARGAFLRAVPLEQAIETGLSSLVSALRTDLPATEASDVRTIIDETVKNEVNRWISLVSADEAIQNMISALTNDVVRRCALEAQIMSVTIVRDALGDMSDKQLNALVYDKVEPDLLWIRMNGSIVGAAVGFVIFLITAATGRLL